MSAAKTSPYRVQVLDRALSVIEAIARLDDECSLSQISEAVSLHKSTAHRILMVLERHRIVSKNSSTGRYRLGVKLMELGSRVIDAQDSRHTPDSVSTGDEYRGTGT